MNAKITRLSVGVVLATGLAAAAHAEYRCTPAPTSVDRRACEAADQSPEALRRFVATDGQQDVKPADFRLCRRQNRARVGGAAGAGPVEGSERRHEREALALDRVLRSAACRPDLQPNGGRVAWRDSSSRPVADFIARPAHRAFDPVGQRFVAWCFRRTDARAEFACAREVGYHRCGTRRAMPGGRCGG